MPHHSLSIRSLKFKCSRFCGKSPSLWWYLLRISQYTIIWLATSFSLDERLLACVRARLLCLFIRLIVIYVSVCCSHFCESITLHIVNFHDSFEPRASEFRIMFMLLSVVRPLFSFWWARVWFNVYPKVKAKSCYYVEFDNDNVLIRIVGWSFCGFSFWSYNFLLFHQIVSNRIAYWTHTSSCSTPFFCSVLLAEL